eukprot:scaffold3408_cov98-Alexandrium_tamarense.AAC.2
MKRVMMYRMLTTNGWASPNVKQWVLSVVAVIGACLVSKFDNGIVGFYPVVGSKKFKGFFLQQLSTLTIDSSWNT